MRDYWIRFTFINTYISIGSSMFCHQVFAQEHHYTTYKCNIFKGKSAKLTQVRVVLKSVWVYLIQEVLMGQI